MEAPMQKMPRVPAHVSIAGSEHIFGEQLHCFYALPMGEEGDMADTNNPAKKMARGRDDEQIAGLAIRHAGQTLESDPKYIRNAEGSKELTPNNATPVQQRGEGRRE
jgi:hypothetical protein